MKLSPELVEKIRNQLDSHFGVDIPPPKFKLIKDPQKYFQTYTGENKKFSIKEMMGLDEEVTLYFNDDIDAIVFKGFRRNGARSFKVLPSSTYEISYVIHEWLHHIQVSSGGYSDYDFFDEACDETVTYVLTADIPHLSDYFDWIVVLWNLLEVIETKPGKKYELIRDYNTTENKTKLANSWLNIFIKKYPKIASTRKKLINILESDNNKWDSYTLKVLNKIDSDTVRNIIYKLHDTAKESLYSIFR